MLNYILIYQMEIKSATVLTYLPKRNYLTISLGCLLIPHESSNGKRCWMALSNLTFPASNFTALIPSSFPWKFWYNSHVPFYTIFFISLNEDNVTLLDTFTHRCFPSHVMPLSECFAVFLGLAFLYCFFTKHYLFLFFSAWSFHQY